MLSDAKRISTTIAKAFDQHAARMLMVVFYILSIVTHELDHLSFNSQSLSPSSLEITFQNVAAKNVVSTSISLSKANSTPNSKANSIASTRADNRPGNESKEKVRDNLSSCEICQLLGLFGLALFLAFYIKSAWIQSLKEFSGLGSRTYDWFPVLCSTCFPARAPPC